jgi:hypothetical protein
VLRDKVVGVFVTFRAPLHWDGLAAPPPSALAKQFAPSDRERTREEPSKTRSCRNLKRKATAVNRNVIFKLFNL